MLIASRLAPDVGVTPGSKETWRDSLGDDRLKSSASTIYAYHHRNRAVPAALRSDPGGARGILAEVLQRITLGVPLALRVLVEAEGGPKSLRHELNAWSVQGDHTASRENALYELYEKLTDRFLLHVHDEEHLHAIIALAITTDANKDLLVSYWGGPQSLGRANPESRAPVFAAQRR